MANEVVTKEQQSALATAGAMLGGLRRVSRTAPRAVGGDFMRFGKDGKWSFGRENKEVDTDNDYAVLNVLAMKEGYVCWEDNGEEGTANKKLGEVMAPVNDPIDVNELEDHGFDWKRQQSIQMKFIEGAYEGTQTVYAPSSQGGLEALGSVIERVNERIEQENPYFFPICAFDQTWYKHPKWGKTYKPVIDIVGWADVEGNEDPEGGNEEPAPKKVDKPKKADKPKPAARSRKKAEPEPEEEPEVDETEEETPVEEEAEEQDAKPVSRRRRR